MPELKPDHLIVRYLSNEASAEEQEQLFEWISRDQENHKIFNQYIDAWSTHTRSHGSFDVKKGLDKLNAKIDAIEETKQEKGKVVVLNRWSIAAAIVLLVVSCFVLLRTTNLIDREVVQAQVHEVKADSDRIKKVTLPDGSIITLNKNASLHYAEAFASREVHLTGEAFFDVAKDSLRPFVIYTHEVTTTVLGTSFNIQATTNEVVVSVATGKVKVSDGTQTEMLKPYEKVTYHHQGFTKQTTTLAELDWTDRALIFEDASLEEAARKIAKHFEVSVSFKNDALKKCLITGKFKNQSLETVLKVIAFSNDMHYVIKNDVVELSGRGCN